MKVEIAKGIYWVGAIDWDSRFCGAYNTPRGTTYNSYLIMDEKIALVDSVKMGFEDEHIARIEEIVNPGEIDYIISNHVEMDHSGAIPEIMDITKKAKVIATKVGIEGLKKHYGREWDFVEVKTGDELSLGEKTLMFISAPMLHWPDSMFTYIKKEKILMPNDVFAQHIATTKRYEDEVGEAIWDEAAKYFGVILMPYSPIILKKIREMEDLGLDMKIIAPSHGAIWREKPQRIVDAYIRWAKGIAENKIVVVYDTMWESTKKMVQNISRGIESEGVEAKVYNLRNSQWSDIMKEIISAKGILLGTPTLNMGMYPTVGGFLTFLKGLKPANKIAAAFGSYGWGKGGVSAIYKELEKLNLEIIKPGLEIKYVPNKEESEKCFEFGRQMAKEVKA